MKKTHKAARVRPIRPVRSARPSKLDLLTSETAREYAHQHTMTVASRIKVLQVEVDEIDRYVVGLQGALANTRDARAKLQAKIKGLNAVVERRSMV